MGLPEVKLGLLPGWGGTQVRVTACEVYIHLPLFLTFAWYAGNSLLSVFLQFLPALVGLRQSLDLLLKGNDTLLLV